MRLLLHIGMPKTGTSTLQEALHTNRRRLRDVGVRYPDPGSRMHGHALLVTPFFDDEGMPREFRGAPARARHRGVRLWDRIANDASRGDASTMILSTEYLYGLREDRIESLAALLRSLFDPVEVVCYVREPASYYVSLTQQVVRGSGRIQPPARFRMRTPQCLGRYEAAFDGRVEVRAFQPTSLVAGDIVTDFLATYAPEGRRFADATPRAAVNESLSAEAMCVLQQRHLHREGPVVLTRETARLVARLRELEQRIPCTRARLRPEIEAALVHRHRSELAYLHDAHGVVFDDIADPAPTGTPAPPGWEADDLASILVVEEDRVEALDRALRRGRRRRRRVSPGPR